jgi:lysophospholipase L1-like esterase
MSGGGAAGGLVPAGDAVEAAIRVRGGLPGLRARAAKAARGSALGARVVYVGGSVTAQRDGWRPQFHSWLERALPAPLGHDAVNAALGNAGSKLLTFMLHDWVLPRNERPPDLVILETAINDGDALLESGDATGIRRALEGIVRGVKQAAPSCELLLVISHLRTDLPQTRRSGTLAWVNGDAPDAPEVYRERVPSIHEQVAEHYGIPTVNVSTALRALSPQALDALFRDDCHTTPAGGAAVASIVAACVAKCLHLAATTPAAAAPPRALPPPPAMDPLHWAGGRAHAVTRADLQLATDAGGAPLHSVQTWDVDPLTGQRGQWWLLAPGDDALVIHFSGTALALLTHLGPDAGVLRCEISPVTVAGAAAAGGSSDDAPAPAAAVQQHALFDQWCYYYRLSVVLLAEGLPHGRYSARISLDVTPPDRSVAKRPLQPAVAGPLRLWLSHYLVLSCGAYTSRALTAGADGAQQKTAAAVASVRDGPLVQQRQPVA